MTGRRRRRFRAAPVPVRSLLGRVPGGGGADPALAAARAAWPGVVGDAVAGRSAPVRRSRAGVVTVACADGMWAQELDSRREDLADALRAAVGDDHAEALTGLRFTADEHALRRPEEAPAPDRRPPPTPEEVAAAEPLVAGASDPELRALLARAAAASGRPAAPPPGDAAGPRAGGRDRGG